LLLKEMIFRQSGDSHARPPLCLGVLGTNFELAVAMVVEMLR